MPGTRSRKIYRDITTRPTRTALVTLSVFVGVLAVVVLTTLGQIITRQLEKDLIPDEMPMLRIYVSARSGETPTPADLDTLRDHPGVTAVEGQAVYEFFWKRPGEADFHSGHLYTFSEPFDQIKLEPVRLLAGRYPVEGQREIAIEQRMADAKGLDIGDTLVVRINGSSQDEFQIVGLIYQPYFYVGGGTGSSSAYATYADAQDIVRFTGFSSIYARFKTFPTAQEESRPFRKKLAAETPYDIVFYLWNNPQNNPFLVGVRQFARVLVVLALVALAVSSVLVTTVITTIMAEQHQQIGAMKALGATWIDILRIYLGMAFAYGLLATIPAVIIGVPLGQEAAKTAAPMANVILEDTSPPLVAILAGIALGLGVPVLAALIPVLHGARTTIREAMTDRGITAVYGRGLLPKIAGTFPAIPLSFALGLNNMFHHKARLALTLLTLTLAVTAFMGVFAVFQTLNSVVGDFESKMNYKVSAGLADIAVEDIVQSLLTDMEEQIREIKPGVAVQLATDLTEMPEDVPEEGIVPEPRLADLYVTGLETTAALVNLQFRAGNGWATDPTRSGIVITPRMAGEFGKTVGDTLRLVGPENTADFEIIGIASFPIEMAFMEWRQLAAFIGDIYDAPIPNAYWEPLEAKWQDGRIDPPENDQVWALGINAAAGQLLAESFDPDQPGAVIVSEALAQAGGYVEGGTITLHSPDGSLLSDLVAEDSSKTYTILKIVPINTPELSLFATALPDDVLTSDQPPLLIAMYWAELASLVQLDYRAFTPQTFAIDLANPEASASRMNHTYTRPVPAYENQAGFEDRFTQTLLSLGMAMSMASVLMAVVGGIGLLTITSIGVFERQREIGVMRSVGASSSAIIHQFLLEGMLVGVLAWIAGLPLSAAFAELLIDMVPYSSVIVLDYTLVPPFMGLAGMVLVTIGSTLYPALTAARKTVSEILRYQ